MIAALLDRRNVSLSLIGGLIVFAWLALVLWEQSPYGRYIHHGQWTEIGLAAQICSVLPAGAIVLPAVFYVGGWLLMSAAMMLPTTLPLLGIFDQLTERRPDRATLLALVILGYLLVWVAFGLAAFLVDTSLHALVIASPWLSANSWAIGAVVLATAGAFQFSALKYYCLEKCRTPFSFVNEHWRGQGERQQAFRLGLRHGIFCVGCCWAIMLLMFVVGTGSVGWMLVLGAVMAVEKNISWGGRLSAPLGIALLAWSGFVVAEHVWR